jgi:U4/U6.U5 tri-snRNP component SNU23
MGRRVWDKEYFKEKYEQSAIAEPPKKVIKGPTESLRERDTSLAIDEKLNKRQLVTNASAKNQQGGFYCEVCDCLLRDSRAYYDHINGRSHNRMLGMTMNVEKVTVERVIAKMERIKAGLE